MTTKLVDMNVGIQLTLLVDGKQKMVSWSAVCPSESALNPETLVQHLLAFLDKEMGTEFYIGWSHDTVSIAKPKKIKAPKRMSQEEFNRRIRELQP